MKDLLQTQKRIRLISKSNSHFSNLYWWIFFFRFYRSIIDEWLAYCRNALGVLNPDNYLFPETPSYLDEKNACYNKILIFRRKSKSADLKRAHKPRNTASSMSMHRSRSAFMSNWILLQFIFITCSLFILFGFTYL